MKKSLLLATVLLVAGCASRDWTQGPSYVEGVRASDAPALATEISNFVQKQLPAKGAIDLQGAEADSNLTPQVIRKLDQVGFSQSSRSEHRVSFAVQPLEGSRAMLMVVVDDTVATRMFARNPATHNLAVAGPLSVREPYEP